jgi:hypothetical protein
VTWAKTSWLEAIIAVQAHLKPTAMAGKEKARLEPFRFSSNRETALSL